MNDELDPKLREFEAKLRQLKPLAVSCCEKVGCRPPGGNVRHSALETQKTFTISSRLSPTQPPRRSVAYLLSSPEGRRPTYRRAAYALATAAMAVLVIVWFTPQPQPLPPQVEPTIVAVIAVPQSFPTTSPTMRQQLAALLDEMNVADPIAETKPVYPVVEIVVCDAPPKATVPLPLERRRFWGTEQEMLSMF